jgi:hypothetical protein
MHLYIYSMKILGNHSLGKYANSIAYIFDLKTPQVWIGRPMKRVFK